VEFPDKVFNIHNLVLIGITETFKKLNCIQHNISKTFQLNLSAFISSIIPTLQTITFFVISKYNE